MLTGAGQYTEAAGRGAGQNAEGWSTNGKYILIHPYPSTDHAQICSQAWHCSFLRGLKQAGDVGKSQHVAEGADENTSCTQPGVPKKDPEMTASSKLTRRCADISANTKGELDEVVCEQHRLSTNEGLRVSS